MNEDFQGKFTSEEECLQGLIFHFLLTSPEYEDFQGKFTSEEECLQDLIFSFSPYKPRI